MKRDKLERKIEKENSNNPKSNKEVTNTLVTESWPRSNSHMQLEMMLFCFPFEVNLFSNFIQIIRSIIGIAREGRLRHRLTDVNESIKVPVIPDWDAKFYCIGTHRKYEFSYWK